MPRIIASWRPVPELPPLGSAQLDALAADLDEDLARLRPESERRPGRSRDVWHCTLRAHPDSPALSDARWAEAARRVLAATGVAPDGDPDGCRWLALRVDSHEIRIIAPMARADGRPPRLERDISRAHAVCQLLDFESRRVATVSTAVPRSAAARASSPTVRVTGPAAVHQSGFAGLARTAEAPRR
ncbi:hypothetical protein ACFVUH_08435 [Kitasatospora sp. NPDC058032]|uniref:hypothetical protein n=1 Tax=Kitasatospora sp. NPDC058032 TaxID=3346307 RepID=UPI0036DA789D